MKLIIGGSISIILSVVGFTLFFPEFLNFLAGTLPIILLLSGGVALYLYREMRCEECDDDQDTDGCAAGDASGDDVVASEPAPEVAPEPEPEAPVAEEAKEETPAQEPAVEKAPEEPAAPVSAFIGNTDSMVFHSPECKFATSKKCTASFATADEAVAAGYKPCGVCKP